MCASRIIETSLAPSPMARVMASGSSLLMSLTTSAFWLGETLQQMTPSQDFAILRKNFLYSKLERINVRAWASTRMPLFWLLRMSWSFWRAFSVQQNSLTSCGEDSFHTTMSFWINLQDNPMFSAVSSLSPVSIHILMLASCKSLMVSGTLSWSRSSTAVAPRRTSPLSYLSNIWARSLSLLRTSSSAWATCLWKSSNSSLSKIFIAMSSVLSPFTEAFVRKWSVVCIIVWSICSGSSLDFIMLSAPFVYILIRPSLGSLSNTLIRFRSELNSIRR
mmetsp:Transcript_7371/g.6617  ORF Transcript_7371/g.6617 Transcript_7371/m.6617 type:complete len:276 (-) Transcript_7371:615-1442(-)